MFARSHWGDGWWSPRRAASLTAAVMCTAMASEAHAQDSEFPLSQAKEPSQFAYNYAENETARALAMAGAQRGAGNGTTALFLNPANMVSTRVYHIEAMAQITPEYGRQVYGGAIVDSVTSRLAGGLSVHGGFLDPDGIDRSWLDVRLGLAYPISPALFVGLSGRYLKVTQDGLGVLGDSLASGGLRDPEGGRFAMVNEPSFDTGVTIHPGSDLYISIVGQHLSYPDNGVMPTTVTGAIGYAASDFTLEFDGLADFTSYVEPSARLMAGGEYLAGDHFPLRAGYRFDQGAESHALSGGLGYIGQEFSVEASVRRTVAGPSSTMLSFGVAYFLESTGLAGGGF